jgi:K+-transporting ATPase c subunit
LETALFQVERITQARNLSSKQRLELEQYIKDSAPSDPVLNRRVINVLKLNLWLDKEYSQTP